MSKTVRQFGTWSSPLSPAMLAGDVRLLDIQWDSDGHTVVWLERHGKQGAVVAQTGNQAPRTLTESGQSVRGGVNYGGGEYTVANGIVYFAAGDGRLYQQALAGGGAVAITPGFGRVASPSVSADGQWVIFVHTYEGIDGLAIVDAAGTLWSRKLAYGSDFVMQPTWHPAGTHIAYVTWNHPQMPWDGTQLHLAVVKPGDDGVPVVHESEIIAGDTDTAVFQPEFSPDGRWLLYASDATGWSQLDCYNVETGETEQLTSVEAEHSVPPWQQSRRMFGWLPDSKQIYFIRRERGFSSLWQHDLRDGRQKAVEGLEHYTHLEQIAVAPTGNAIALLAASSSMPMRAITFEPDEYKNVPQDFDPHIDQTLSMKVPVPVAEGEVVRVRSSRENLGAEQLSPSEAIEWQGQDGDTIHGIYYPPTSERYDGDGAPPLIVSVHGGPSGQTTATYDAEAQFFATRGYAVLAVNHRGSTGYGKNYKDKLRGNWGVYDVEDCASGATYLVRQNLADNKRLVIMGGSAGGYTVLLSLLNKPGFYRVGISRYGISNLFTLAETDWKFEARYNDTLVGALPGAAAVWRERSVLFHADSLQDPLAIFQGEDDEIVPREQSDNLVAVLRSRQIPHEYHVYPGEGHGWRQPATIEAYYTAVLAFLKQYVIYA